MKHLVDLVVEDAEGRVALVVEVRGGVIEEKHVPWHVERLRTVESPARFGMIVDRERIRVVDFHRPGDDPFAAVLSSVEVLSTYDPEYASKRIFSEHLESLTSVWLMDLAIHWKHDRPAGSDELARIGLLKQIERGEIHREVEFATHPVH